uniref:Inositol polyphosphate-related phosphatase domain-containing protein n=1 Tax=Romanomermis culicivorax TaxID=13658 RepID=A0A915HL15_ROMCU
IRVITFNVNGQGPPSSGIEALFNIDDATLDYADVIVIGFQEISFHIKNLLADTTYRSEPWSNVIRKYLADKNFVHLSCGWASKPRSLGLSLLVFVKRPLVLSFRRVETNFVRTGLAGVSGHKGAVCVRLTYRDGTFLTFINCHLSADIANLSSRIKDYITISSGLKLNSTDSSSLGLYKKSKNFRYTFWFGDLNFRIEYLSHEETLHFINRNSVKKLLDYDQLNRCRVSGRAFSEFHEFEVKFLPTYKLSIGKDSIYDKRRVPSYCDRILYKLEHSCNEFDDLSSKCEPLFYDSIKSLNCSDHLPVVAAFNVKVFSYIPLAEVEFMTDLNSMAWYTNQNNLCKYKIRNCYNMSPLDWIGIFDLSFNCDESPVTWIYTLSCWEEENNDESDFIIVQNILFKRWFIPKEGSYIFGYYSRERSCLIGLSDPFEIYSPSVALGKEATPD